MSAPLHERGPAPARTGPTRTDAAPRQNVEADGTPVAGELHRRRSESYRREPLLCGCQDPLSCRHGEGEPCDDATLDRWLAAAALLTRLGFPPLIPRPILAALTRRERS